MHIFLHLCDIAVAAVATQLRHLHSKSRSRLDSRAIVYFLAFNSGTIPPPHTHTPFNTGTHTSTNPHPHTHPHTCTHLLDPPHTLKHKPSHIHEPTHSHTHIQTHRHPPAHVPDHAPSPGCTVPLRNGTQTGSVFGLNQMPHPCAVPALCSE